MTDQDLAAQAAAELSAIPIELRQANAVSQANSVTAIMGVTGSGKSSLADTAAEYAQERFDKITLCYATDPGGFGNKRLSLIRLGIMRVWDPTNHVRPFETMELISLGAWPEEILDPDRGYADPNVRLILPRRLAYVMYCPSGHLVQQFDNEAVLNASNVVCPSCGVLTSLTNTQRVEKVVLKSKQFHDVGLRIYDSVTAMNDRGLLIELPTMSAKGELPAGREGGSALGSADAFRQGSAIYGTGSKAQVGFMQNRSYGWLVNIRQIPDQVIPAICTFGIEQSKATDESGGEELLGMKIAGNARTAAAGGWVGNLLHASKEPDDQGRMRHRLWLTTHVDPRRADRIPYVAKHRGTPLGMPDYLEDPWNDNKAIRDANAWTVCSLKYFFELLEKQFEQVLASDAKKFPNAPALRKASSAVEDEILPIAAGTTASAAEQPIPVTGGRTIGRRSGRRVTTVLPDPAAPGAGTPGPAAAAGEADAVPVVSGEASAPSGETAERIASSPILVEQLKASLAVAAQQAGNGRAATDTAGVVQLPPTPVVAAAPVSVLPSPAAAAPSSPATTLPPTGAPAPRIRRVPRPPTTT